MIDTAQRIALYPPRSGLSGLTVADFVTLLNGGTPEMTIDTSKRIALYPGRSGLPGATVAELVALAGGGGGGALSFGTSTIGGVSNNTELTLPLNVTQGANHAFLLFLFGRDPTGSQKGAEVTNLAVNGSNFDNTFEIASTESGGVGSFQHQVWLIRQRDFGSFPGTGQVDFVFTLDDGTTQEFIAAIFNITDLADTVTVFANAAVDILTTPLVWPVSPVASDAVFLIGAAEANASFSALTTPAANAIEQQLSGANTRLQVFAPNGPYPLTDGQTQGAGSINTGSNVIMVPAP